MKRVYLGNPPPAATLEQKLDWVIRSFKTLEEASAVNDPTVTANAFTFSTTFSETTGLTVSAPTLANTNLVLATLIQYLQKGGQHRTT